MGEGNGRIKGEGAAGIAASRLGDEGDFAHSVDIFIFHLPFPS